MALTAVESNESPAPSLDELVEQGRQVASQISSLDAALVDIVRQIRQLDHEHWGMTTRQYRLLAVRPHARRVGSTVPAARPPRGVAVAAR